MNNKAVKVRSGLDSLNVEFNNEDLEKENDFTQQVENKLRECEKDINGDPAEKKAIASQKEEEQDDGGRAEQLQSL